MYSMSDLLSDYLQSFTTTIIESSLRMQKKPFEWAQKKIANLFHSYKETFIVHMHLHVNQSH